MLTIYENARTVDMYKNTYDFTLTEKIIYDFILTKKIKYIRIKSYMILYVSHI